MIHHNASLSRKSMKINENNIIERLRRGAKGYLSDNEAAETVVGDVIYNIWEMRENLNIHTSLRSYLIRSVKNRSINYLQQEYISKEISINSLPEYTEIESFYFIEKEHPLEKVLESELEKTIAAAIGNLPEECRTAFILSRIYNKKYDEIADQMGISVNTVKYHIKNALSKLRLELKDYLIILLLFLFSNFIT